LPARYSRPALLNEDLRVSAVDQLNTKLRERVSTITADVQSLRRRLEMVQQERARAYQERDGLKGRLNDAQYEVRRIENTLNNDRVMEKQNTMVQDEIKW
jgi:chromosome segregation ATPase